MKASGLKIKVIEQTGISLKRLLQRSNPFKSKICGKADCMVYINGGKGPCDVHGVTYSVTCMECVNTNGKEQTYIGETSRNTYTRGKEHLASLARKEESSVLWKHSKGKHNGRIPRFCMSVMGQFKNDAMLRQVSEAVMINKEGKENTMNNKNEWNYITLCGGLNNPHRYSCSIEHFNFKNTVLLNFLSLSTDEGQSVETCFYKNAI